MRWSSISPMGPGLLLNLQGFRIALMRQAVTMAKAIIASSSLCQLSGMCQWEGEEAIESAGHCQAHFTTRSAALQSLVVQQPLLMLINDQEWDGR